MGLADRTTVYDEASMHDVATFLVRRDHRLAREIRDLIQLDDHDATVDPTEATRLARLRFALDAALTDWLDEENPLRTVTTTAGHEPTQTTTWAPLRVPTVTNESQR